MDISLPFVTAWLALGFTFDIGQYEYKTTFDNKPIFSKSDMITKSVNDVNSRYYVLQDNTIPYEDMGIPIDAALRLKYHTIFSHPLFNVIGHNALIFLVVTDVVKYERSMKEGSLPIEDWEDIAKEDTHYIDKEYYGQKVIVFYRIYSSNFGDTQIIRKKFTEVMGVSGVIGDDIKDRFQKAVRNLDFCEDIRGSLTYGVPYMYTENIKSTYPSQYFEDILDLVTNISMYEPSKEEILSSPVSYSFDSLHNLDERYPDLKVNEDSKAKIVQLEYMLDDLREAEREFYTGLEHFIPQKYLLEFKDIEKNITKIEKTLKDLIYDGDASMYKAINETAYDSAFKIYYSGLQRRGDSYASLIARFAEDHTLRCENQFEAPAKGFLEVESEEVVRKGTVEGGLEECQELCAADDRCRAIGYSHKGLHIGHLTEKEKECMIYYRTTRTATIHIPENYAGDMKIYERKCRLR